MDLVIGLLPLLALLVCPLMMVACVVGMRRMAGERSHSADASTALTREQHVADLQRQLQAIQTELTKLQAEQQAAGAVEHAATDIGGGHAAQRPA